MNGYMHPWFSELTKEFKEFWMDTQGVNHKQLALTDEYWIRCAFCWIGWKGCADRATKKKVKHEKKTKKS